MSRRRTEWTVRVDTLDASLTLTIPALCMTPRIRARLGELQRLVATIGRDDWNPTDPAAHLPAEDPDA